ncbi:flavin reductase family protein [Paracoccus sp. 22332]|uniref:flavin reductase family protein n=1 Tax=Paracoccus sp. 22332 TaxID=3453913 RepID=UPI003F84F2E5
MGQEAESPPAMSAQDGRALRNLLGHYPTGVCAITTLGTDRMPVAMIVGTFTSVSLDPPLVGFLPARSSSTWPVLRQSGRFCVNILSADQSTLCRQLSGKGMDRFAGVSWRPSPLGDPVLDGVVAWIHCRLEAISEAGDHDFVLGRVQAMAVESGGAPLVFHRGTLGRVA